MLRAGELTDWTAELLLATAVGTSLLTTFAGLAADAGLTILGYVAQQTPTDGDARDADAFVLRVTPCITVASAAAAGQARALWDQAMQSAPLVKMLRCRFASEPHIIVLPAAPDADQC